MLASETSLCSECWSPGSDTPTLGLTPWFQVKGMHRPLFIADGRYVVAAGENSERLSVYEVSTGKTMSRSVALDPGFAAMTERAFGSNVESAVAVTMPMPRSYRVVASCKAYRGISDRIRSLCVPGSHQSVGFSIGCPDAPSFCATTDSGKSVLWAEGSVACGRRASCATRGTPPPEPSGRAVPRLCWRSLQREGFPCSLRRLLPDGLS